jgi:hypothetical protein
VFDFDSHVFEDRVADVILDFELTDEGLIEEEEAGTDEEFAFCIADLERFVDLSQGSIV